MWLLIVLALVLVGCGGGSPVAPSAPPVTTPPAPPLPAFVDGWSGAAISAVAAPAVPSIGTMTAVRADGYLLREAPFDGQPFRLWPQDEEYVRALVYAERYALRPMRRWTNGFAVASSGLDPADVETLRDRVAEIARLSGLDVTVREFGPVKITVNPNDPFFAGRYAAAYTSVTVAGGRITGANIVFSDRRHVSRGFNALLHELGHVLGLSHSLDSRDLMYEYLTAQSENGFSERERVALAMMYRWRRPGNVAPDREAETVAADASVQTDVIID